MVCPSSVGVRKRIDICNTHTPRCVWAANWVKNPKQTSKANRFDGTGTARFPHEEQTPAAGGRKRSPVATGTGCPELRFRLSREERWEVCNMCSTSGFHPPPQSHSRFKIQGSRRLLSRVTVQWNAYIEIRKMMSDDEEWQMFDLTMFYDTVKWHCCLAINWRCFHLICSICWRARTAVSTLFRRFPTEMQM